jgi:hypothetical protein
MLRVPPALANIEAAILHSSRWRWRSRSEREFIYHADMISTLALILSIV